MWPSVQPSVVSEKNGRNYKKINMPADEEVNYEHGKKL